MARKEEFKHKGYYVVHIEIADKHNPNLVMSKWSVWGLGIYSSWEDAEQAILEDERERMERITRDRMNDYMKK